MAKSATILFCQCSFSRIIDEQVISKILSGLEEAEVAFETVDDLCGMAARKDVAVKRWVRTESLSIVACFPRAVKWLFSFGGASLQNDDVKIFNMRTESPEDIIASLIQDRAGGGDRTDIYSARTEDWVPWFPVIDYDRCGNCKQCLNFCLFGVYSLCDEEKVQVVNPANCKTNCPACARVCPEAAIIFPKYSDSPINGDEVDESSLHDTDTDLNFAGLSHEDIRDMIRKRSKGGKRFARDTDALNQGGLDFEKLREKLDIPPEVLASFSAQQMFELKGRLEKDKPSAERGGGKSTEESSKRE